jgi:AcrR family transcriptional regulator
VSTTGVARPALYSAFGNKEDLFRQVLTRYYAEYLAVFSAALEQTVLHGMAVQAKAGFDRETLNAIAAQALAGWPSS